MTPYRFSLPLLLVFIFVAAITFAQESLLINTYTRNTQSLDGYWKYIVDPYEGGYYNYRYQPYDEQENPSRAAFFTNSKPADKQDRIEYDFDTSDSIAVPGDWNTRKEKLYYYEGSVWYKKSFDYSLKEKTNRVFVYFGAANYRADVYLNGQKLGTHIGGFTPFNYEVTGLLKDKDNFLVVKVDNKRHRDGVPTLNTDWWNYGGLTRSVKLVETPETFIRDYFIRMEDNGAEIIKASVTLDGPEAAGKTVRLVIPGLGVDEEVITGSGGTAIFEVTPGNLRRWSTQDPHLYEVTLAAGKDMVTDNIGFRTVETSGSQILLNGEPVFLRGISVHEESPVNGGRGNSIEDARQLLTWAKELGCNFVRLAHYPHNEHMVRLADKMGILVWEENPVYWTVLFDNEDTYLNAQNQLTEVINRDKNRASVIIWSMANETPPGEARTAFLTRLANRARELDPTRLISAALEIHPNDGNPLSRTIDDPFAEIVDILAFNQYIGWYDGLPDKCAKIVWEIEQDKPVIVSELGAGARQGLHGDKNERWTEEFQTYVYTENLKMIDRIPQLAGVSPWILVDFRSPRRVLPRIQDDYNRKGLISEDGRKKMAFDVLKNWYAEKAEKHK